MGAYNKFLDFVEQLAEGTHDLDTHTLKIMLVNSPAPVNTNTVKADLTEISAGNGYAAGGTALSGVTSNEAAGVYTLDATDVVFTAAGGAIGPFRYAVLYNDTAASDNLIGWWDYGSSVSLNDTETLTIVFGGSGILTLT